jgi:hypothetical protein
MQQQAAIGSNRQQQAALGTVGQLGSSPNISGATITSQYHFPIEVLVGESLSLLRTAVCNMDDLSTCQTLRLLARIWGQRVKVNAAHSGASQAARPLRACQLRPHRHEAEK